MASTLGVGLKEGGRLNPLNALKPDLKPADLWPDWLLDELVEVVTDGAGPKYLRRQLAQAYRNGFKAGVRAAQRNIQAPTRTQEARPEKRQRRARNALKKG